MGSRKDKDERIGLRLPSGFVDQLRVAAVAERRSLNSMCWVLLREALERRR